MKKEKPFYEDDEPLFVSPIKGDVSALIQWVLVIALVLMVGGVLAWGMGWFDAPLRVTSSQNVERLSREANDEYQSLQGQLRTIESVRTQITNYPLLYGEDTATWAQGKRDEWLQLQRELTNKIAAYNRDCGQYNSMWQDEWRDIPAPDDLPKQCEFIE